MKGRAGGRELGRGEVGRKRWCAGEEEAGKARGQV